MKAKKVLNSSQGMEYFSQTSDHPKNGVNDETESVLTTRPVLSSDSIEDKEPPLECSTSGAQSLTIDLTNGTQEEELDRRVPPLPALQRIPQFVSNRTPSIGRPLPPMPSLKDIPIYDRYIEPKDTIYESVQSSTDQILNINCVDNEVKDNNSINANNSSLDSGLLSEITKFLLSSEILSKVVSTVESTSASVDSPSLVSNESRVNENQTNNSNVFSLERPNTTNTTINTSVECLENRNNCIDESEVLNTSINTVTIDLNDNSNSPKNFKPTETTSVSNPSSVKSSNVSTNSDSFVTLNTSSIQVNPLLNTIESNETQINGISNNKPKTSTKMTKSVKRMTKPITYCAKNYRIFNMTRHSGRLKTTTQEEDFDYDQMANASWSELDGSQYECVVSKWVEDYPMNEDKRKEILREVEAMAFVNSLFDSDSGVSYCFTAFEAQSNRTDGLKCVMRLDTNAVKRQRFSGSVITRMFVLSGQSVVTTENGKQKKNVETGHEVYIPAHTRYTIENRTVESSYFYVIVTRSP